MALGNNLNVKGEMGLAVGNSAEVNGDWAIAIGNNNRNETTTTAQGAYAIALGTNAKATNTSALALGTSSAVSGFYATALGTAAKATVTQGVALGLLVQPIEPVEFSVMIHLLKKSLQVAKPLGNLFSVLYLLGDKLIIVMVLRGKQLVRLRT